MQRERTLEAEETAVHEHDGMATWKRYSAPATLTRWYRGTWVWVRASQSWMGKAQRMLGPEQGKTSKQIEQIGLKP
jgi:hypothetical protein